MSVEGNLAENFCFKESRESYKIATELDKKLEQVVMETLKIVLERNTYEIAKNLPLTGSAL